MIPAAFAATGNRILRLDQGHTDAGNPVPFALEVSLAPAGAEGDVAFDRVRLVLTWTAAASLTLTPSINGVTLPESAHRIELPEMPQRTSRAFELVLRRRTERGAIYALRGTWLGLRIEGVAGAGEAIVDPCVIEYEVLTPTQERGA